MHRTNNPAPKRTTYFCTVPKRDLDDKHKLIIDEDKAPIIREIFERAAAGETTTEICHILNQRQMSDYQWTLKRVWKILKNELYKGTLVQRRTESALYKNETRKKVPESEQIRIENAVPAIVDSEIWEQAQVWIAKRAEERKPTHPPSRYKGLTRCGKCGRSICADSSQNVDLNLIAVIAEAAFTLLKKFCMKQ